MAYTLVQHKENSGTTAALAVGASQGWAAPTAGNLLVAFTNSNGTATTPTGFTAGPSRIGGNGAYTYYKVATGSETTITFGNGATHTVVGVLEYSGAANTTPLDVSNSGGAAGGATSTPALSVTTTVRADLVLAFALLHSFAGGAPTAPAWTNAFTNEVTIAEAASSTACAAFVADLTSGNPGTVTTQASWTGSAVDRAILMLALAPSSAVTVTYQGQAALTSASRFGAVPTPMPVAGAAMFIGTP